MFVKYRNKIINLDNVVKISLNDEFIIITLNHSDPDIYLEFKTMAFADMAFTELSEFLNNPPENKNVFDIQDKTIEDIKKAKEEGRQTIMKLINGI